MKKLWFPLMLLFILLNVSACNAEQECPIEVQVETRNDKSYPYNVIVTSVTDSITINDVIVNRGNAKPFWSVEKPATIKFGEILSRGSLGPQKRLKFKQTWEIGHSDLNSSY